MTSFSDMHDYVGVPRLTSLRLSPDGGRLVGVVQALNPDGKSYGTALWEIPLDGRRPYRLTRSLKGEAGAEFTAEGDVLFGSRRPDPTVKDPDDEVSALWLLPAAGGEARQVASRPGGIDGFATGGPTVVFASGVLPGDESTEAERRKARKDAGISAILHEGYPVRYWDHDLGPGETRLFAGTVGEDRLADVRDLTPEPGKALTNASYEVTPDGATAIATWAAVLPGGELRSDLVAIEIAGGGARRVLASEDGHDFEGRWRSRPTAAGSPACAAAMPTPARSPRSRSGSSTWPPARARGGRGALAVGDQVGARLGLALRRRRPPGPPPGLPRPGRRLRAGTAHRRRRRLLRGQRRPRRDPVRAAQRRGPGGGPVRITLEGAAGTVEELASRPPSWNRPARSPRSPRPPTTARRSAPGWCCPRAPPPTTRRRCCCGSTAGR
nr:hypothetical protein GCM10020093_041730 [Planobispora longispora]